MPIIDIPTYEIFLKVREKNKTRPAHRIKQDYLLSGHLKCACNLTWRARTATKRRSRKGEWIERKTPIGTYFCPQPHKELRSSNCPKSVSAKRAEAQVWEKLCKFLTNPAYLLTQAKALVDQLQADYELMLQAELRVREGIEALAVERREFITQARKERMDDADLAQQIGELTDREVGLKRRLAAIEQDMNTHATTNLEARVNEYLGDLQAGMEGLKNATPQIPEESHDIFLLKKHIVDMFLAEAIIDENREIHVKVRMDLLKIAGHDSDSDKRARTPLKDTDNQIQELFHASQVVPVL